MNFTKAIVRAPSSNFAEGLTTVDLGVPDYRLAIEQHEQYCRALEQCGLTLTRLPADPNYPDSTFVEDAAIITPRCAILTNPGALSRAGEISGIKSALAGFFPTFESISPPGTVDGGDICDADDSFIIGVSERTNEEGARQLAGLLEKYDYRSTIADIRGLSGILHLKSGIAYLGDGRLVIIDELAGRDVFKGYELIRATDGEEYAANCVRINDYILIAAGHPAIQTTIAKLGYKTIALEMSEFQKMDGGLSCLSLRF